ncbi:MAG: carbon starvation CstA family protein, partial [archaeon]
FGHHFASIAGAGPIIGPILAVSYFGWFAVVLWIALGTFFIGAVHDYLSLMLSVRHKGEGIAKVTEKITGKKTFYIFSILLWFALLLIITVFSVGSAQSLIEVPELVVPFFGITLTALFLGFMIYKFKKNKLLSSLIAIALVVLFIFLGIKFPLSFGTGTTAFIIWLVILFIYALIVSILPVWTILQPRDYISSISLFLFLGVGLLAIFIVRPILSAPAFISSSLPLWPILFVTVACGAVSGFHALVSSGTTSKQLDKETDGRPIAFGGMIAEGIVALLVVIFITAGLSWGGNGIGSFAATLSKGWIIAFSSGFSNLVNQAFPFISLGLLVILGSLVVNIFILTSLDTSTRIGRMLSGEMLPKKWNKKILLTLAILIPAFILAITNTYVDLWRIFGSANQLIAAVVLTTISAYFVEIKKPKWYTLIPAGFMLLTTLAALVYGLVNPTGYILEKNIVLILISLVLIIFALIVFVKLIKKIFKKGHKLRK